MRRTGSCGPREQVPWMSLVRPPLGSCPEQMMGRSSRMQGKELSEQTTAAKSNVGIDACKSWLDTHVLPSAQTLRVPNTGEGIRKLKRWLDRFEVSLVVVEATGKWHRQVHRSLLAGALQSPSPIPSGCAPSPRQKGSSPRPIASMLGCWRCLRL